MSRPSTVLKNGKNRNSVSKHIEKNEFKSLDDSMDNESNSFSYSNLKTCKWTKSEDTKLFSLIMTHGVNNWETVAKEFDSGKSAAACLNRWHSINKPNVVKGPWNVEEDKKLIDWIKTNGASNWTSCSEFITGRSGKQCRERWLNALNPLLKKGSWEPEEDYIIFKLFKKLGSKWSIISNYISGRTENSIKNRFYSTLRRIAAESKTISKKSQLQLEQNDLSKMKLSLDTLMEYFGDAYNEKTKYIDSLVSDLKLSENEVLNSGILREILSMKLGTTSKMQDNLFSNDKFINQAKSKINDFEYLSKKRDHKDESSVNADVVKTPVVAQPTITHNFNNNINLNICINPSKPMINDLEAENVKKNLNAPFAKPIIYEKKEAKFFDSSISKGNNEPEKEDYKKLSLDALASRIDSFCQMTHEIGAPLFGKEMKEKHKAAPKDNTPVDTDKINNLLNQLSDLENLLHMTKNELIKIDTNTVDFGYSQKIQTDLHEFEMPLLSTNVIDREFQS